MLVRVSESFLLFPQKSVRSQAAAADDLGCPKRSTRWCLHGPALVGLSPRHTSMFTVSRWYFGSLARFTFSVRVCHTRTWKTPCVSVKPSTEMKTSHKVQTTMCVSKVICRDDTKTFHKVWQSVPLCSCLLLAPVPPLLLSVSENQILAFLVENHDA